MDPLITVIAPNLNEKQVLPSFLDSLNRQTWRRFELVLVDGFSTDGSLNVFQNFSCRFSGYKVVFEHKRNIGYVRNKGALFASAPLLFHTNSDNYFPPDLLQRIQALYVQDSSLVSVTGRTRPLNAGVFCHFAYGCFDVVRMLANWALGKYRPSGSFIVVRSDVFAAIGGFPEVCVNEGGRLGEKLDGVKNLFCPGLWVGHHAKRFSQVGNLQTFWHYIYVLGNFAPVLRRLFRRQEIAAAMRMTTRSDLERGH